MQKANTTIEVMEMSPKEKWLYENRMKCEYDKASWKHVGYQEGIAEGTGLSKEAVDKLGVENPFYGERLLKISLRPLRLNSSLTIYKTSVLDF